MIRCSAFALLFFLLVPCAAVLAQSNLPRHDIRVRFDPGRNIMTGISTIRSSGPGELRIGISGLSVTSASINGIPLKLDPGAREVVVRPSAGETAVRIEYEVGKSTAPAESDPKNPGVVSGNILSPAAISLTDNWHPSLDGLAIFSLTAVLPEGLEAVSEADEITARKATDGQREFVFDFPHPAEKLSLVAGGYVIEKTIHNNMDIYTYLLPEEAALGRTYSDYAMKYLDMYDKLLGKYPYKRFSVVENFLPTGYAMPTFTLLGRDVIRLPFIVETSLGHEMLHQWLGCSVYVDHSAGNWSEGLTTYLSDHRYEDLKGKGPDYRRQMLGSYQSYVTAENDMPLSAFQSRGDKAEAAVGYNKAAMVFHMLKRVAGEDKFNTALRRFIDANVFRRASWKDLMTFFEDAYGGKLDWFYKQWVEEKGMPEIELSGVVTSYRGAKTVVSFDLIQKDRVFRLRMPIYVRTKEGGIQKFLEIDKPKNHLEIEISGSPLELVIDEDYDVFRRLTAAEFQPLISRLLGDGRRILVLPDEEESGIRGALDLFGKEGFTIKKPAEVNYEDISRSSLLIMDQGNSLSARLLGKTGAKGAGDDDMRLSVKENPFNPKGVIALLDWKRSCDITPYVTRTTHYGRYSDISFKNGRNTGKTTVEKGRGIRAVLAAGAVGVEIRRLVSIENIIDGVRDKKVVYLGEIHDKFEHHRTQFEIIRGLHRKNSRLVIGMEMFQKPYQKAIDDYISGEIGEKEFLKRSEYFSRWSFDYNLYREILLYAREHKVPVVALNIRKELVSKVSKEGIYSLPKKDLADLPEHMDFSDIEYRLRLREFFLAHQGSESRNFDFFYQAQVLWDEAMAHNINEYMLKNPDSQMVVLAGGGHMAFGSGIPKRSQRLNGLDYSIVLSSEEVRKDAADFIVYSPPVAYVEAPKLMVMFRTDLKTLQIAGFPRESVSEKAGLKRDDILLSIDGEKMSDLDDVKIYLLYKKKGDTVTVTVRRERFLLGPTEKSFDVTL